MLKNKKWVYLAGISAILAAGCAKEKPYDIVYKGENKIFAKNEKIAKETGFQAVPCTDPKDPCVYVPATGSSQRKINIGTIPYHMGISRVVNFRIEDDKIRVVDLEKESRFSANSVNDSLALSLPVKHKDYRCREDANGDCGNVEEENNELEDRDKRFVEIDFEGLKAHELNTFQAGSIGSLLGCTSEQDSRVKKVKLDNGALNITVEKDYKLSIMCIGAAEDIFRDSNFTVQYTYSFVPLSKIASKDYEPVPYTDFDEDKFGFFKTETSKISVDNQDQHQSYKYYLNRWNPKKKEIVYYLNDTFYKPHMKHMLKATEIAINNVNTTLKNADVNLQVKLKNGSDKDIGDIRNNFIIMVEDPQNSGILGYAPTAKNPFTGEIIHGRAMMYYGTIAKFVSGAYIELYNKLKDQKKMKEIHDAGQAGNGAPRASAIAEASAVDKTRANTLKQLVDSLRKRSKKSNGLSLGETAKAIPTPRNTSAFNGLGNTFNNSGGLASLTSLTNIHPEKMMGLRSDMSFEQNQLTFKDEDGLRNYDFYSTNNAYHGDLFDFGGVMTGALNENRLSKFMNDDGTLRNWKNLNQDQRKEVIDIVMPFVWVPTLVHELGHTLGLRHNFYGSVDKDNWYSKEELASIGINQEIPLSTVMDYPGTQVTELPVMGKYDIAALRFAYNREVKTKNGETIKVKDTDFQGNLVSSPLKTALEQNPGKELKDFMYCSDEHVAGSPQCNRHDLGVTYVDIAKYYVDQYAKRYDRANFRNDRASFSVSSDMSYAGGVNYYMRNLRSFFELYDNLKSMFNVTDEQIDEIITNDATGQMDWLKDIRDAMMLTADFYIDQISTPDTMCAVVNILDPNGGPIIVPLQQIASDKGKRVATCFDTDSLQLPSGPTAMYVPIGEAGKSINNKKDTRASHHMTSYVDQIDVRGTWMDKVFAMRYLTQRKLGSIFDSSTGNYLDIKSVREKVLAKINEFAMNKVTGKLTFRDENGDLLTDEPIEYPFEISDTHKVHGSLMGRVNKYFGLKRGDFNNPLFKVMIDNFIAGVYNEQDSINSQDLESLFTVYKLTAVSPVSTKNLMTFQLGNIKYAASERNVLAQNLIMMAQINQVLDAVPNEVIEQIIASRADDVQSANVDDILNQDEGEDEEGDAPAADPIPNTPQAQAAAQLPTQILQMYLDGEVPTTKHIHDVLLSMPTQVAIGN